jgi:hypothetical protein
MERKGTVWPPQKKRSEEPGAADSASLGEERRAREGNIRDKVEGEGSYSGSADYNERTKKFVASGKVEQASEQTPPQNDEEKQAMLEAERIGKKHAKGEDPALRDPKKIRDDPNFPKKQP